MEEDLREAACLGNLLVVQKLLKSGVSINSQNSMNGWTALHWASKRGHATVVMHLMQSGADANIKTHREECPLQLATSPEVRELLASHSAIATDSNTEMEPLPIAPSYLKSPVFPYYDVKEDNASVSASSGDIMHSSRAKEESGLKEDRCKSTVGSNSSLTLKARLFEQNSSDPDFVEVEVPSLTYSSLLASICEELEIVSSNVAKIRKLPNVLVRKDKDVQRLKDGQELEVILLNN